MLTTTHSQREAILAANAAARALQGTDGAAGAGEV